MPPYIEPSTATMRKIAGPRSFSARKRSDQGTSRSAASAAGTSCGCSAVWIMIQAMKAAARSTPGMKPAVNSFRIETSPRTP